MSKFKLLNEKGSSLIQAMIASLMVLTLSGSLTTLNIGRAKASISMLRKAAAISFTQAIAMHLADDNLCKNSVQVTQDITVANHGALGIPMRVHVSYPLWENTNGLVVHPVDLSGPLNTKLLPEASVEDSQLGDSRLYVESIRFRLPITGGAFDQSAISTFTLPDGAGGLRNIVKYQGQLVISVKDGSSAPTPIAPTVMNFIINVDTSPDPDVFESCSADRGIEEYCEQIGCEWLETDHTTGLPLAAPKCKCQLADVGRCPDVAGQPQFIRDFDPAGNPICDGFFVDCGEPANYSALVTGDPTICWGAPLRCHGLYLAGFESNGSPVCRAGGNRVVDYFDCQPQLVTWVEGSDFCQANLPAKPATAPPIGAFDTETVTMTDSVGPATGSADFVCTAGQLIKQPGSTCTSPPPLPTYTWVPNAWQCGPPPPPPVVGCTPGSWSWVNVGYRNFNTDGACAADNPTGGTGGWDGSGNSGIGDPGSMTCDASRNNYFHEQTCSGGSGAYARKRCQQCQSDLYTNAFCASTPCPFGTPTTMVFDSTHDHIDDCLAAKALLGPGTHSCESCGMNNNFQPWRRYRLWRDTGISAACP